MTVNVFVYGTLMPGECNHDHYCRPFLQQATMGYVFGEIYHLPQLGYPGVCEGTDQVWGYCLTFGATFSLKALDALEDYVPQRRPDQNEYQRCQTTVFFPGDRQCEVWIYRMTPAQIQRYGGIYLPSGKWSPQDTVFPHSEA
ncbi:MAG: gamma-glutamylcyclotransferase [Synechocystis sp.]|nr:gamma-glutamylcyclotransferase [Synechocystis sp.]